MRGYVSRIFARIARWAEDLTLDLAPGEKLSEMSVAMSGVGGGGGGDGGCSGYTYSFLNMLNGRYNRFRQCSRKSETKV